jgi:hypothetical protein
MGAHSAMPVYPAAMSTLAQPMMPPGRWHAAKVTAGVLCFVAVVLVVASSFLPLYSGELGFGGQSVEITVTPWHADVGAVTASESQGDVPKVGYPMVFAAVILACAAAACWYAATPTARQTAGRAAAITTSIGGAFLIGTAWTTALLVSNSVDYLVLLGTLNAGFETDATYLVGYWLLLTASVLAFTAAILSLIPARQRFWQPPMPMNPYMSPSYGMAQPMDALPQQATPSPGQVNPLTGHPVHLDPLTGQPAHFPSSAPPPAAQVPGYPLTQSPSGPPLAPGALGAVDPLTGQPVSPPSGLPSHQGPAGVNPVTGQPFSQGMPVFAQGAAVDPVTGQPVAPATGQVSPPATPNTLGAQLIAPNPIAQPAPFSPEPVGQVNGAPATPVAEPAPAVEPGSTARPEPVPSAGPEAASAVVPDAPALPETPPGPAIPPNEDPLVEPPRTP